MKEPRISIFIPVYNRATFIEQCVQSALNQTVTDSEICICDDGSTDGTSEILKQFQKKYPEKIRLRRHRQNQGMAAAYQTALSLCRGRYILQLDSDDTLYAETAETLSAFLDAHDTIGLVYASSMVDDCVQNRKGEYDLWRGDAEKTRQWLFMKGMTINHPRMFRRSLLDGIRLPQQMQCAVDYELYLRIAEKTAIGFVPEALYHYRLHGRNVSTPIEPFQYNPLQQISATLVKTRGVRRRLQKHL